MEKRTRSSLSTLTAISTYAMLTEIPEWLYFITNKSTHLRRNNVSIYLFLVTFLVKEFLFMCFWG